MTYELAKKLKDAGFPQPKNYKDVPDGVIYFPSVIDLIHSIRDSVNEFSIGWNDSGCFWHIAYGNRGASNHIEGTYKTIKGLDDEELDEVLANLYLALHEKS